MFYSKKVVTNGRIDMCSMVSHHFAITRLQKEESLSLLYKNARKRKLSRRAESPGLSVAGVHSFTLLHEKAAYLFLSEMTGCLIAVLPPHAFERAIFQGLLSVMLVTNSELLTAVCTT